MAQERVTPEGSTDTLFPGTYYLFRINEKHHRTYERTPSASDPTVEDIMDILSASVDTGATATVTEEATVPKEGSFSTFV
jgi:hypothetical protein